MACSPSLSTAGGPVKLLGMVGIVARAAVTRIGMAKLERRVQKLATLRKRADATQSTKASLVDEAYDALKSAIRQNVFPPGYQAAEQDIAQQLGMSRTPVHEAVIRLEEEGLVQVLPRRGVAVRAISPDDIREIYDVLIALEGTAAALLARQAPEGAAATIEALERETKAMEDALDGADLLAWANADERFHQLLTERCGNRRLARMVGTVLDQSHRARMFTLHLRPRPAASVAEHRKIIDAIRRSDPDKAETLARSHRIRARDMLLPLLEQYGMRNL
jgi:DNA-binding GntR family transcriptional regulator